MWLLIRTVWLVNILQWFKKLSGNSNDPHKPEIQMWWQEYFSAMGKLFTHKQLSNPYKLNQIRLKLLTVNADFCETFDLRLFVDCIVASCNIIEYFCLHTIHCSIGYTWEPATGGAELSKLEAWKHRQTKNKHNTHRHSRVKMKHLNQIRKLFRSPIAGNMRTVFIANYRYPRFRKVKVTPSSRSKNPKRQ